MWLASFSNHLEARLTFSSRPWTSAGPSGLPGSRLNRGPLGHPTLLGSPPPAHTVAFLSLLLFCPVSSHVLGLCPWTLLLLGLTWEPGLWAQPHDFMRRVCANLARSVLCSLHLLLGQGDFIQTPTPSCPPNVCPWTSSISSSFTFQNLLSPGQPRPISINHNSTLPTAELKFTAQRWTWHLPFSHPDNPSVNRSRDLAFRTHSKSSPPLPVSSWVKGTLTHYLDSRCCPQAAALASVFGLVSFPHSRQRNPFKT